MTYTTEQPDLAGAKSDHTLPTPLISRKGAWLPFTLIFLFSLGVAFLMAQFQQSPGYMDAEYYYLGGVQLAWGYGFNEPILWNYLDDPDGLPHPSHTYWPPLASIVSYLSLRFGKFTHGALPIEGYKLAQISFFICAGVSSVLSAALSFSINRRYGSTILAGFLAALPGFYLPYVATSDTFVILMVLGASFFLLLSDRQLAHGRVFALGSLSGLMHLARADGFLWFFYGLIALFLLWLRDERSNDRTPIWDLVSRTGVLLGGYLLFSLPWFLRNWMVHGSPVAPGGIRTLWLTTYDQLFTYPPSNLNFENWWATGLDAILRSRLWALGQNFQTAIAVQGGIYLVPLVLFGIWKLRRDIRVQLGVIAWISSLVIMTVIFPFPGARGGFFHSGSALQPLIWSVAPAGLYSFVNWGERTRGWRAIQAERVFGTGLIVFTILLSVFIAYQRVIGASPQKPVWSDTHRRYDRAEQVLVDLGAKPGDIVMVNNPPGFYLASSRPAIVIPDGDIDTLLAVASRYQAGYLILEPNHPRGLQPLYDQPRDHLALEFIRDVDAVRYFKIHR